MKRILSGVQATGSMHLGNYLGALKPWVELQGQGETFYFIPDLHTLNIRPKPDELRAATLSTVAWLLAAGIDPTKSTIFQQSRISAHSELAIILENYTTIGELGRMTQYKDKSTKRGSEGQLAGLFTYPVLMAADILLYDATHIPVGEDQKQHVELARDIAQRFNQLYGDVFTVPQAQITEVGARIMSLQDPGSKMSKSDIDQSGTILLLDDPETIRNKIKRAVTDSGDAITEGGNNPALVNLLQISTALGGKPNSQYVGRGYGDFKTELAELIIAKLEPLQARYHSLINDKANLLQVIEEGSAKARASADTKLQQVKQVVGLI